MSLTIQFFGRSTVLSSTIPPSMQPSFAPYGNKQIAQQAFKISRAIESNSVSQSKGSRPPPRAPPGMNYIINVVLALTFFLRGGINKFIRIQNN